MSDPLIKAIFEDRDNWGDRIQGLLKAADSRERRMAIALLLVTFKQGRKNGNN